jgi:hypothetical protein
MMATIHSGGEAVFQTVFFILVGIIVGASVIVTALKQIRAARSRVLELQVLTERLQFDEFNPNKDPKFVIGWGFLSRLSQGSDRYAFNILRGTYQGQALFVFDYHFQTQEGKNTHEHLGTILMLIVKQAFPKLTIGPETLGEKIETAFGIGDDIKFESAEFSRNFCVRSKDKKFAYDVCNPQMIEYLLANRGLEIEIQGPVISLAFEPQLPVRQIEFNLQRLIEIRSRLPEYLFTNT